MCCRSVWTQGKDGPFSTDAILLMRIDAGARWCESMGLAERVLRLSQVAVAHGALWRGCSRRGLDTLVRNVQCGHPTNRKCSVRPTTFVLADPQYAHRSTRRSSRRSATADAAECTGGWIRASILPPPIPKKCRQQGPRVGSPERQNPELSCSVTRRQSTTIWECTRAKPG